MIANRALPNARVDLPDFSPHLLVIIDTEEDFDWSQPLARTNTSVESISSQHQAQSIFRKHALTPTYVIDYPVASAPSAITFLKDVLDAGECQIGAHLHPWVNPPFDEDVTPFNSYPGNLPANLEYEKLARLTDTITTNFGVQPTVYKAGRYGIGSNTPATLERLGYRIDASVVPYTSFAADGGPDFSDESFQPFFFGSHHQLLEIPVSCGFCGWLTPAGARLYPRLFSSLGRIFHLPGVFARLGLLERIRLTPEGIDLAAQKRLTKSLLRQGCKVFSLTYHSPSLSPSNTPYVRNTEDLKEFLQTIENYLDFFFGELEGKAATPESIYRLLRVGILPSDQAF